MENKVKDLMTPHVITIKESTPFTQACRMFKRFDIHHLPVTNDRDELIGMFSATDALTAFNSLFSNSLFVAEKEVNDLIIISEIMSSNKLYSLNEDDDIQAAIRYFAQFKINAVPVMRKDIMTGILTSNDILKALTPEEIEL